MSVIFKDFAKAINDQMTEMSKQQLYVVGVDGRVLGEKYLDSFPINENTIFRNKRVYECTTCLDFIRKVGNIVTIKDGVVTSIWDVTIGSYYQEVADKMSEYIKSLLIDNVYVTDILKSGNESNVEFATIANDIPTVWYHFNFEAPTTYFERSPNMVMGEHKTNYDTMRRALKELKLNAAEDVLELMNDNNLEKGPEYKHFIVAFIDLKKKWDLLTNEKERNIFLWENIKNPTATLRNSAIGSLLIDLSGKVRELDESYDYDDGDVLEDGYLILSKPMLLEDAVSAYEFKVSGENFKRPNPIITEKMAQIAMETVATLGIRDNLERRFAKLSDIKTTNRLWSDLGTSRKVVDPLATALLEGVVETKINTKNLQDIDINDFIKNILPTANKVQAYVDNDHSNNFVSLIAPLHDNDNRLFKWNNEFSWAYVSETADTIKQRVIDAGGSIDGILRVSLIWENIDDLDLHIIEPNFRIHFNDRCSSSSGILDTDKNAPHTVLTNTPVENVIYTDLNRMPNGIYTVFVHNYKSNDPKAQDFKVQVAIGDEVNTYSFKGRFPEKSQMNAIHIEKTTNGIKIVDVYEGLKSSNDSKDIWGVKTQRFIDVTTIMYSPNFWDEQTIGNKHFMFVLKDCLNPNSTRGIFNEYLREDLNSVRKAFEVIGSKMKCSFSEEQVSGLGFPSTKDGTLICKVTDRDNKVTTYKINIK